MSGDTATRRDRRAAERQARKGRPNPIEKKSGWRSPMVLLSVGALVVGVFIVAAALLTSGVLNQSNPIATPALAGPAQSLVDGRSLGSASAPVTVDLWADFQCPSCKAMTDQTAPLLIAKYVSNGTVRLNFHDMAFIGPESVDAATAARVAQATGPGFWPMHDLLYANQGKVENAGAFTRSRLGDMAVKLGMDRAAFLTALDDPTYRSAVTTETTDGTKQGIQQTPTFVINGQHFTGSWADWATFSSTIDAAASAAGASPAPSAAP